MTESTKLSDGSTPKLTADQVIRFGNLFTGYRSGYGVIAKASKKRAKWCQDPLPLNAHELHLTCRAAELALANGWPDDTSLGIVPVREDGTCYVGLVDVDDHAVNHQALAARIKQEKLPLVVVRSTSGGAHCFLFLKEAAAARLVIDYLARAVKQLGLRNPTGSPIEVFPKQHRLPPGHKGSWFSLPDFRARHVVTPEGPLTDFEAQLAYCEAARLELTVLGGGAPIVNVVAELKAGRGPACLVEMATKGIDPPCGRNNGLLNLGVYAKLRNDPQWEGVLQHVNDKVLDEGLGVRAGDAPRELESLIKSLSRRADKYHFKCLRTFSGEKCPHASQCRALLTESSKLELPDITDLVKVMTDPPYYRVHVDGAEVRLGEIESLMSIDAFRRCVAAQVNIVLPKLKQPDWDLLVQDLLSQRVEEDVPDDAGDLGRLRHHLYAFLESRHKSDSVQDLNLGRAVTEGDKVLFQAGSFEGWLRMRRVYPRGGDFYEALRQLGCRPEKKRSVKGAKITPWSFPLSLLEEEEQTEPFDHPEPKPKIA